MSKTARDVIADYMIHRHDGDENYACGHRITESDADKIITRLQAAGLVIVPKEPTEQMYAAANREWDGRMSARSCGVWQAMIAAAPSPPSSSSPPSAGEEEIARAIVEAWRSEGRARTAARAVLSLLRGGSK